MRQLFVGSSLLSKSIASVAYIKGESGLSLIFAGVFRSYGAGSFSLWSHGLRRGLGSVAATRLVLSLCCRDAHCSDFCVGLDESNCVGRGTRAT
jgi:hypothetical protein